MKYNPQIHHRKSIRLKGYDYSQAGAYFITICIKDRECLFGKIVNGEMILNDYGKIANDEWLKTAQLRPNILLEDFVIMPNHMHGIIVIDYAYGRGVLHTPNNDTPNNDTPNINTPNYDTPNYDPPNNDLPFIPNNEHTELHMGATSYSLNNNRANTNSPLRSPSQTIGAIVRGYKSSVTKQINILRNSPEYPVWQRNFHEHIIRNEQSFKTISNYIIHNPANWRTDNFLCDETHH